MHEIRVPEMGESITEGTLSVWIKKNGEEVRQGEVLAEIETDKVNVELSAEADGILQIQKQEGEDVRIGEIIGILKAGTSSVAAEQPTASVESSASVETGHSPNANLQTSMESSEETDRSDLQQRHASPAERKRARERHQQMGTDSSLSAKTSSEMNVANNDVAPRSEQNISNVETTSQSVNLSDTNKSEQTPANDDMEARTERVKMSRRRKTIASRLLEAQHSAAMLTTFNEVDLSAIMEVRNRRKEEFFEANQVKLGYMSFFTKAVVSALKVFPYLNAEIQGDEMILKKFYDIGIAVSTDEGLVVPVVRHADQLNFAEIEQEIARLAERARNNELWLTDLQGGTFTITNGGVFGSLLSTPILNTPQVGILGMHTIQHRPVAIDKKRVEIRPMMYIALSYDHRIVDGKEAVQFLVKVKQLLEDPEHLLLEG